MVPKVVGSSPIFHPSFLNPNANMVDVAQLVRVPDCGSEGRGFEPHLPPSFQEESPSSKQTKQYIINFMLNRIVEDTIRANNLFTHSDIVLVALSGGADSVALLHTLHELKYKCKALHCNFHLRGEESDRDQKFAENLCSELGIEIHVKHFDTNEYASQKHISIEMAARELRYDWFEQCVSENYGKVVAVAHHEDDNVETFIINLTRGSGINGLKGMKIKNGNIVRPLLNIPRADILSYLESIGQEYVTDSTNLQNEYTRNKIRLDIIPLFEKINPSFKKSIAETAQRLSEAAQIYDYSIKKSIENVLYDNKIDIEKLKKEISAKTVLFEILYPKGFNQTQINNIYNTIDGQPGKKFFSSEYELIKDRTHLIINKINDKENKEEFILNDNIKLPIGTINISEKTKDNDFKISRDKKIACIDKDKINGCLRIRKWENGDKFQPIGMKGKKNISDFLTDIKKNITEKNNTYLLTDDHNIIWVIGERLDDRYKITDNTKRILTIALESEE